MKLSEIVEHYHLRPFRYQKKGKTTFLDTKEGRFAFKEKNNHSIYPYLNSRNFHYYPKILSQDSDPYQMTEYIEEVTMPEEQKLLDMMDLLSLLHSKTSHFKEIKVEEYKELYEDISNNIVYLKSYYEDMISLFEKRVFMSPSEYLFSRNVSQVFSALHFCEVELEKWYNIVKEQKKVRYVVLHNNLDLSHFLKNQNSYFISWEKAKFDMPIFDLYKLYKRITPEYDFKELLERYEMGFPLLESERRLFFLLIALPDKIEFHLSEYEECKKISRFVDSLYKTEHLLLPYYAEEGKHEE